MRRPDLKHPALASHFSPGYVPLERRVVGNSVWTLLEHEGRRFIALDLIKGGGRCNGWGSKGMSEDEGPCYYDCPLALLDQCTETDSKYAKEWRSKVREFHAKRKERKQPETGMTVTYGGTHYRLHTPAGPRKGWHVVRCGDGAMFRMSSRQLSEALS